MTRQVSSALLLLLVLPSVAHAQLDATSGDAAFEEGKPLPAARGRLIVKYATSVRRCAKRILAEGDSFERDTGSPSLDELNAEIGVRTARPLAIGRAHLEGARATAAYLDRLAAVRARFPERAARVPVAAEAPDLSNLYVIEIDPERDVAEAARLYAADPAVIYAQPDYEVRVSLIPNDPFFSTSGSWGQGYEDLWGLHQTEASAAWDVATGQGIVVAIVDTGLDMTHPDLEGSIWTNPSEIPSNGIDDDGNGFVDDVSGWDFWSNDNDPTDRNGHGTHVAGTVAAVGNNSIGVLGMSWGAQVMALRTLNEEGSGYESHAVEGILYAAENGADVINNSWIGFRGPSDGADPVTDAVTTARALGAVVVAAAGNDGADLRLGGFPKTMYYPAGIDGVITVAASTPGGGVASFSNFGRDVSVSAPGLDVLSLRGQDSNNVGGHKVAVDYLRLNGTSMAAPHVSGLVAVLLSALPSLTVDQVQWHIELNADQLGYPGYEGEAWNPRHGWGRINATQVFDTPPVTTRLEGELLPVHDFSGVMGPSADQALNLVITTLDPVQWSATAPSWLEVYPSAGTTGGQSSVSYDTTGMSLGSHGGEISFDVPLAVDGGAAAAASLYVHRDERVGPEMIISDASDVYMWKPSAVSNGLGTLVVWREGTERLMAAHVDAAGTPSTPYVLYEGLYVYRSYGVATDGHGYIVVWGEEQCKRTCARREDVVRLLRLDPQGQPVDGSPITVARRRSFSGIAFDGEAYTLLFSRGWWPVSYTVQRLGRDGVLWHKSRRLGRYPADASFACATGTCLLSWSEFARGDTTGGGFYIYRVKSVQIIGDRAVDPTPKTGPSSILYVSSLVSDGENFLVIGQQHALCGEGSEERICRQDAVAARLAPDGSALDEESFPLNYNSPFDTFDTRMGRFVGAGRLAFDGTSYVLPFTVAAYSYTGAPKRIFLARLRPDGSLVDSEDEGLLVRPEWKRVDTTPEIAIDALHSLVVFREEGDEDSIRAVPMLARAADPSFAPATIGAIGTLGVDEGEFLKLALSAPDLDPATTTFAAGGLPYGAHLDAATGLFVWRPHGAQEGTYAVRFEAADESGVASEDVTITVAAASLSISGTARLTADGSPVSGVALRLAGIPKRRLTAHTDALGRFRFDDLIADRRYRLSMARPSTKEYRMAPRGLRVSPGTSDVTDVDLQVSPR